MSRLREIVGGIQWAFRFGNPLEILATRHLFRRKRTVVIEHGGMQMLIDSQGSDASAIGEVLLEGMYDTAIRRAAEGRESFRYVNLGANIGAFDIRVCQLVRPGCLRVKGTAIEMNPATHARLTLNLELNRLYAVRSINAAVWDQPGETLVRVEERDTGQSMAGGAVDGGCPVPLLPWTELFTQAAVHGPIDLLKIDIEGAEERVVPQITAADRARVRFLVIETHGLEVDRKVKAHLGGIGFREIDRQPGAGATHLSLWGGASLG